MGITRPRPDGRVIIIKLITGWQMFKFAFTLTVAVNNSKFSLSNHVSFKGGNPL